MFLLFLLVPPPTPTLPSPAVQSASSTAPMGIVCVWARWSATSWITVGTTAMRRTAPWSPSTLHRASSTVSAAGCCSTSVPPTLYLTPSNNTKRNRLTSSTWFSFLSLPLLFCSSLGSLCQFPASRYDVDAKVQPEGCPVFFGGVVQTSFL